MFGLGMGRMGSVGGALLLGWFAAFPLLTK